MSTAVSVSEVCDHEYRSAIRAFRPSPSRESAASAVRAPVVVSSVRATHSGPALPVKFIHLGDVTPVLTCYFVRLDDGRAYQVDIRYSDRALRVRMIPSRRCVTLSQVTLAAINHGIFCLEESGRLES